MKVHTFSKYCKILIILMPLLASQVGNAFYSSDTGHWLNRDPIQENGGINLYQFVGNDPNNRFDPYGLFEDNGMGGIALDPDDKQGADMLIGGMRSIVNGAFWVLDKIDTGINKMRCSENPTLHPVGAGLWGVSMIWGGPARKAVRELKLAEEATAAARIAEEIAKGRDAYEQAVKGLARNATKMRADGKSSEEIARALHAERDGLKMAYRKLTPPDLLRRIEERQMKNWGNPLGPTIKQLRAKGKSWEDILESAQRPDGSDIIFTP